MLSRTLVKSKLFNISQILVHVTDHNYKAFIDSKLLAAKIIRSSNFLCTIAQHLATQPPSHRIKRIFILTLHQDDGVPTLDVGAPTNYVAKLVSKKTAWNEMILWKRTEGPLAWPTPKLCKLFPVLVQEERVTRSITTGRNPLLHLFCILPFTL